MDRTITRQAAFAALSIIIVAILAGQLIVGLVDTGRWGWPLIAYPMYKTARYDGDRLDDFKVYALLKDGTKTAIDPDQLGMGYWIFTKNVVNPLRMDRRDRLAPVVERYCKQSQGAVSRLELYDIGIAISARGPVETLQPQLIATMDVNCE